ncbi:MAG: sigma-54-dependent Fis family transcriptional regulator [Spirochaetaceae bacterium]|nr:MAG: sigma-54-dependent Fis family transcriptional regulator [Spirochaetaceae bacterium]
MRVLVVDDEKNIRESVQRYLSTENIETVAAENGLSAKRLLQEQVFSAGIIDLRMPGMDGLELLKWIREQGPRLPVIMISAYGEVRDAVEAMKLGAQDYIVKPFDPEELLVRLRKIVENQKLRDQIDLGREVEQPGIEGLGKTPEMMEIRRTIAKVADTPSTVLVTGESGTGKEVIARLIHNLSSRAGNPFIPVNVGGIPETLLESELFGYERGAFTGAERRKVGLFEVASGGTLFLDEIGEMPQQLQVKLLRVLQDKKVQRLGTADLIPVDVRIIAATNHDLQAGVREKTFREDLYYRLNVIHLALPPLRERIDDLPLLIGQLLRRLKVKLGKSVQGIDGQALEQLRRYSFPGNVRELENLLERAMIFAEGDTLTASDLILPRSEEPASPRPATLESLERQAIVAALHRWEGNRTKAAAELGITRRTLLNRIKHFGIEL